MSKGKIKTRLGTEFNEKEKNTKKKRIWIWREDFGDESQSKRKKSGSRAVLNYWLPKIY